MDKHLKNLRPAWVRVRTAACLEDVTLHDLRRTVGSWLVREGSSLHLVGAVLKSQGPEDHKHGRLFSDRRSASCARPTWGEDCQSSAHRAPDVADAESRAPPESHTCPNRARERFNRQEALRTRMVAASCRARCIVWRVGCRLAKACRRANIPVPGRGYWAKVAAAQPAEKRSLPPCTSEPQNRIQIKKRLIRQPGRSLVESDVQVTACP